ncbi:NADH:flavin oxidoreductase/NADH oxidase [soil metagenome]
MGLWQDEQIPGLRHLVDELHGLGSLAGAQLWHSGPKAGRQRAWEGYGPLGAIEAARGEHAWPGVGPTDKAHVEEWGAPRSLAVSEIQEIVQAFGDAAHRCETAGFDAIEVHAAHGYLIHSFLSPISNTRTDEYGGSIENRMRIAIEVARSIRVRWPERKPLFFKLSCEDGAPEGWTIDDSIVLARALEAEGVDVIDCTSGGIGRVAVSMGPGQKPGFQVHLAERIRAEAQIATMAVGLITEATQASDIILDGQADLICIGRQALFNPHWPLHAAIELFGDEGFALWPKEYADWLRRRSRAQRAYAESISS